MDHQLHHPTNRATHRAHHAATELVVKFALAAVVVAGLLLAALLVAPSSAASGLLSRPTPPSLGMRRGSWRATTKNTPAVTVRIANHPWSPRWLDRFFD